MDEQINGGRTRTDGYSKMYHEIFDIYQPYIGDKATLYYLYLLRYKNNEKSVEKRGKAWVGRSKVSEELNFNFTQIKRSERILEAFDLIRIEYKNVHRGRPKHVYYVNHPLEIEKFPDYEATYFKQLQRVCDEDNGIISMLGKRKKMYFSSNR